MEEIEVWKTIPGGNEIYEASNLGRIRSIDRFVRGVSKKGLKHLKKKKGQIVLGNYNKHNKYWMTHCYGKKRETHRWIAEAWLPKVKGKNQVNHKDGNRLNNRVDNLEWASPKENIHHAIKRGSFVENNKNTSQRLKGTLNPKAKLNEAQVYEIKKLFFDTKMTSREISKLYNVGHKMISSIRQNRFWKHVIYP